MEITENKSYRCDFCSETLESQELLDNHIYACVEIEPVVCPVCYLVFGGQVQLDEHMLIVHNRDNRVPTSDRSDEFSKFCCEDQDLNNKNLSEELTDISDNNEGVKLNGDDKSHGTGLLKGDGMVPGDFEMVVDPDDDDDDDDNECQELADNSKEVEDADTMGNLIKQHKDDDDDGDDDDECKELADDSKEVEDADATGNLIEQHKDDGDDDDRKELADDSKEVEDADATGNLIEQHKDDGDDDDDERKELADDSKEVEDVDAMGNLIEQHRNDGDDDDDDDDRKELADDSKEVEDVDAMGNLIEQHKNDDDDDHNDDDDDLKSEEKEIVVIQRESREVTKSADDKNEMIFETSLSNGMADPSHYIEATAEDVEMAAEPDDAEIQSCNCIKCMMNFPDGESWLRHKQLRHSHIKVMVKRLRKHVVLVRRSSQQKNSDQESTEESENVLQPTAIGLENPWANNLKPLFSCERCGKDSASETALRQHRKMSCVILKVPNSGKKDSAPSFSCKMCGKVFVNKLVWSFHQSVCKRHKPHPFFECVKCGKVFTREKEFMVHLSLHDFYCKTRDKIYPSQLDLDQHTCASSEDRILKERNLHCTACDEAFPSLPDLDQHQCSADDNKKRYKCGICGMLFQSLKRLEKHVESHPITERNKQIHGCDKDGAKRHTTDPDRFMVKCLKCSKCFVNNAYLDLHMLSHTQPVTISKCIQCQMVFGKQSDYTRHMRTHQVYCFCPVCKDGFKDEDSLSVHLLTHSTESDDLTCQHCKKRFIAKEYLDKHILSYHEHQNKKLSFTEKTRTDSDKLLDNVGKPFKCRKCHLSFSMLDDFTRHMLTHSSSHYTCKLRKAPFQRQQAYIEHVRSHRESKLHVNGEKKLHQCSVCNKTFQNAAHLASHAQSHVKDLTCYFCEDIFSSPSGLAKHLQTHINGKPYHCVSCIKFFCNKGSLTRHLIRHSWNTLFKCDVCDKTFSDEVYMKDHTCEENGTFYGNRFVKKSHQMQQELKRHKPQNKSNQFHESAYECVLCKKSFTSTKQLLDHIFSKVSKEQKCCYCLESMPTIGGLRKHMRRHGKII